MIEESRISSVEVKFVDIKRTPGRQLSGSLLTLRNESMGSEEDRYPRSPCRKRCVLDVGNLFSVSQRKH